MKKAIKATLLSLLFITCIIILPQSASADFDYTITDYKVDITVNPDNTYNITETITADFSAYRHGIYRNIPIMQEMLWEEYDFEPVLYKTKVKNLSVQGFPYTVSRSDTSFNIKIGDPYQNVIGQKVYVISYDYILDGDKINSRDFVYYDLIGTQWDTEISNVSFNIEMPKEFDPAQLWIYAGEYGWTDMAPVDYEIDGNTISGRLDGILVPGEGLTIYINLPEGYFDVSAAGKWNDILINAAVILDVAALLLVILFRLNKTLNHPDELYPPDDISPCLAAYAVDSIIKDGDLISLILYWATKGHLSIDQLNEDEFKITRLQGLTSQHSDYEIFMFNKLFPSSDPVTSSSLTKKFALVIADTKELAKEHYSKKETRLFSPFSIALGKIFSIFPVLLIAFSLFYGFYVNTYQFLIPISITIVYTFIVSLPLAYLRKTVLHLVRYNKSRRVLKLSVALALSAIFLAGTVILMNYLHVLTLGLVTAGSALLLTVLSSLMSKRTKSGIEITGKLLSLKKFMEKSDKPKLESLVQQSPYYFYNVMPYALIMGIGDIWTAKFNGITMMQPVWYRNSFPNRFALSPILFQMSLYRTLSLISAPVVKRSAVNVAVSFPRGGGGAGGGGSAGGGFGGGGGGSW